MTVQAPSTPGEILDASIDGPLLEGGDGHDVLIANSTEGNVLKGGAGRDIFYSAPNQQIMTGDNGADVFVYSDASVLAGTMDTITDFNPSEGDQLDLTGLLGGPHLQDIDPSLYVNIVTGDGVGFPVNDRIIQVDPTGTGSGWIDVVYIQNGFLVNDVATLTDSGSLLL